jgi:NADH:ubiquinone oxidoreductase subunit C
MYQILFKRVQRFYMSYLSRFFAGVPNSITLKNNGLEIKIPSKYIYFVLNFLKNHTQSQCKFLVDLIVYDIPGKKFRFTLVYSLLSVRYNSRIQVFTRVSEGCLVDSVQKIFKSVRWLEREVFDLYGIFFWNHNDLRRILTDYGFLGHPLRKDFPLVGFVETFYNDSNKLIVYKPIKLTQDFRSFKFSDSK